MGKKEKGRKPIACGFSLDKTIHKRFSDLCKEKGWEANRQIENFMKKKLEEMENGEADT